MRQSKVVALAMPRQPEAQTAALPETIEELRKALADSPRNDKMRLRLAHNYQLGGMWAEAANELALCLPARPDDPDLLCDLASCHLRLGNLNHASVLVQEVVSVQPEHRFARLIESLLRKTEAAESQEYELRVGGATVPTVTALDPAQAAELIGEARQFTMAGQSTASIDLLRRVLALDPGNAEALLELGQAHASEGRWRESYRWFDQARRRAPGDWEPRYRMAVAALHLEEPGKAAALAREALAICPSAVRALWLLSGLAIERGEFEEAGVWLEKLLALDGADAQARYRLAWLALRLGKLAEAAEGFRLASEEESLRADALYHLGLAQLGLGNHREAVSTLSRAWRADGADDAALALAEAHLGTGDCPGAEAALADLSSPGVQAAAMYHKLALAWLKSGEEENAKRAFAAAVRLDHRSAEGYFALQSLS